MPRVTFTAIHAQKESPTERKLTWQRALPYLHLGSKRRNYTGSKNMLHITGMQINTDAGHITKFYTPNKWDLFLMNKMVVKSLVKSFWVKSITAFSFEITDRTAPLDTEWNFKYSWGISSKVEKWRWLWKCIYDLLLMTLLFGLLICSLISCSTFQPRQAGQHVLPQRLLQDCHHMLSPGKSTWHSLSNPIIEEMGRWQLEFLKGLLHYYHPKERKQR